MIHTLTSLPVSYTHLDVYKRQADGIRSHGRNHIGYIVDRDFLTVTGINHQVAQDVYKRQAMNLQECWDLINLSEKTRKHCMILENCCYDWFEMNTLNMAQQGVCLLYTSHQNLWQV